MACMALRKDGNKRSKENAVHRSLEEIAFALKLCKFGILFFLKIKIKSLVFIVNCFNFSISDRAYLFVFS